MFQSGADGCRGFAFAQLARNHCGQAPAAAASWIFHTALGDMHGATASAAFRPQQVQQGPLLFWRKVALIQAGKLGNFQPGVRRLGERGYESYQAQC